LIRLESCIIHSIPFLAVGIHAIQVTTIPFLGVKKMVRFQIFKVSLLLF